MSVHRPTRPPRPTTSNNRGLDHGGTGMIAFISDLHISDRSAGVHFLPAGAFRKTFKEIADQARSNGAREITVVFLGDVVDLIRTTFWRSQADDQKPWSVNAAGESSVHP